MNMRARKALGCIALLVYLAIYALCAAGIGAALLPVMPTWAAPIFYAAAGLAWALPLRPMISWMNSER